MGKIELKEVVAAIISVLRIFYPEQRRWIPKVLIVAGISAVMGPSWAPYVTAVLNRYLDVQISAEPLQIPGWILLILGIAIHLFNEMWDRKPKAEVAPVISLEDRADRAELKKLFNNLDLRTFSQFFDYGKSTILYMPILHYSEGLEGYVTDPTYHIHDPKIKSDIDDFYRAMKRALGHGEYFTETSSPDLQKFDSRHDIHVDPEAKRVHEEIVNSIYSAERHLRSLSSSIKKKYPDFDFDATSRVARAEYDDYVRRFELTESMKLNDLEFSVMQTILDMEQCRVTPTIPSIATQLGLRHVEVQVALDRMIALQYAKHLYRGLPHQKYTILEAGRAYFAERLSQNS